MSGRLPTVLQIFARAPVPGACKRRLIPSLGAARSAALQEAMMRTVLRAAADSSADSIELWCAPDAAHPTFTDAARSVGARLEVQAGRELGERMYRALCAAVRNGRIPVLVGTDCPALTTGRLNQALAAVSDGPGTVLRPARDGGYVCIGARRPLSTWFQGVAWGSARVLDATRDRLRATGTAWTELPALPDIDRPDDLPWLPANLAVSQDSS